MPFLRVIRDKRGYETTYLMHWYREGARQRSRILYVFRTPGGVRVGRGAIDRSIQQEIEARHPDIAFDWRSVVDNQQVIESAVEPRRTRKRRAEDERAPAKDVPPSPRVARPPAPSRPPIPGAIEGSTLEEQVQFLARWHGVMRERVLARTTDPARQEALLALTDRLNPQPWTDPDSIASGLRQAAEALERLSRVFAKRRRRSRRPAAARETSGGSDATPSGVPSADAGLERPDADVSEPTPEPDH